MIVSAQFAALLHATHSAQSATVQRFKAFAGARDIEAILQL